MTVKELSELVVSPIEVKSGFNGKILCKKFDAKKHLLVCERAVLSIWTEIRVNNRRGYSSCATPVVCVFVDGSEEASMEVQNG